MGNLNAMQKEKAKELVELFFNPTLESPMEYAKKCAIKYCDDFMSLNENKFNSYWQGIKSAIENYEIDNKLSSIDWLEVMVENMIMNGGDSDLLAVLEHCKHSKEMHKKEIKKAYEDGECKHDKYSDPISEGYYTNIFGGDKSLMKKLLKKSIEGGNNDNKS